MITEQISSAVFAFWVICKMESPDIYNTKLGEALLRVYSQKRLHVDPDEMGIKFD